MDTVDIYVYDHNFTPLGVIDHYESLIWTDRYYENGDFEMRLRMDQDLIPLAQLGNYLMRHDSDYVMIVEAYEISCDYENGDFLILKGTSLEGVLSRRIIVEGFSYIGEFQTLIHKLLNENVISPSNKDRKIPGFSFIESSDSRLSHYSITKDSTYNPEKTYYTKGTIGGGYIYEGFTGTEFETGITYYEKVHAGFIATTDREYVFGKTYYTKSEDDEEVVYTEYIGNSFAPGETYYEEIINYVVTQDEEYIPGKAYYLRIRSNTYPAYTEFSGSSFTPGTSYYELTLPLIIREYSGGENLYTAISDICQEEGVGFRILLDDNNNFVFSLYMGLDHTRDQYENEYIIFSPEFNNVVSSSYQEDTTTYKNVIYALTAEKDEADMEFGSGIGLSRREMSLSKDEFYTDEISEDDIDNIVDNDEVTDKSDIAHTNTVSIDISIGSHTQYLSQRVWNDNRIIVGSSHTGSSADVEHMSEWVFFNMWLKFPFSASEDFTDFTFNLSYTKAMNGPQFVRNQNYTYGLGTDSAPGSNMITFQWDVDKMQCLNCKIPGEFNANTTYYLWLCYDRSRQNNCYVQGVSINNPKGMKKAPPVEEVVVTKEIDLDGMRQRADEELANARSMRTMDTEIDRVYTFVYRSNFIVGDIVQIEDRYSHSVKALITEIIESFEESGPATRPTFTILDDTIRDDDEIGEYDIPIDIGDMEVD